jgi:hypothetical protein
MIPETSKSSYLQTVESREQSRIESFEETEIPFEQLFGTEEEGAEQEQESSQRISSITIARGDNQKLRNSELIYEFIDRVITQESIPFDITEPFTLVIRLYDGVEEYTDVAFPRMFDYFDQPDLQTWWRAGEGLGAFWDFNADSQTSIFNEMFRIYENIDRVVVELSQSKEFTEEELENMKQQNFQRTFSKGENCLITPILDHFKQMKERSVSKTKIKFCNSMIRRCGLLLKQYSDDGVPEDEVQHVCDVLKLKIKIIDPVMVGSKKYTPSSKASVNECFKFINTEHGHVEFSRYFKLYRKPIIMRSREDVSDLVKALEEYNIFYTYIKSKKDGIVYIKTLDNDYKYETEFSKAVKDFNEITGIADIRINATKTPELSKFVRAGCHFCSCVDYVKNINRQRAHLQVNSSFQSVNESMSLSHIDMEKAYTNFNDNDFYEGFPTKFTDFRRIPREFKNDYGKVLSNIGYYSVSKFRFNNVDDNVRRHIKSLGISCGIYPSVVLKYFVSIGINFDILEGCWCVASLDFMFDGPFLDKNFYTRYCGKLANMSKYDSMSMTCDENLAKIIKSNYTSHYYPEDNRIVIIQKKTKDIYHRSHLAGFITGYCLIGVLQQLVKIDHRDVYRVNLDGIYFDKNTTTFDLINRFRQKDNGFPCNIGSTKIFDIIVPSFDLPIGLPDNNRVSLYIGCGGSGKTHSALTEAGYVSPIFTTISWKLIREKMNDYNCRGATIARLTHITTLRSLFKKKLYKREYAEDSEQYVREQFLAMNRNQDLDNPSVLIVDEATMLSENQYDLLLELYPYTKFIFCGDFNRNGTIYQLPSFTARNPFPISKIDPSCIREFKSNYRCECPELLRILKGLRRLTELNVNGQQVKSAIKYELSEVNKLITKEELRDIYDINDYVLCSRRTCRKCKNKSECTCKLSSSYTTEWTNYLKMKFPDKFKYLITSSSNIHSTGDIIVSDTKHDYKSYEERHAFTMHSIQGMTISTEKIFIDPRDLFDSRMLYIAMSRAKTINQIYFIDIDNDEITEDFYETYKIFREAGSLSDYKMNEESDKFQQFEIKTSLPGSDVFVKFDKETGRKSMNYMTNWIASRDKVCMKPSLVARKTYNCVKEFLADVRPTTNRIRKCKKFIEKNPQGPVSTRSLNYLTKTCLMMSNFRPTFNRMIVTGEPSGIIAIDLDRAKNGEPLTSDGVINWHRMLANLGIRKDLKTRITLSQSGGEHWWFKYDHTKHSDILSLSNQIKGYPGIDIKSNGGNITAPGTRFVGKNNKLCQYRLYTEHCAFSETVSELPDEISDLLTRFKEKVSFVKTEEQTLVDGFMTGLDFSDNQDKAIHEYIESCNGVWEYKNTTNTGLIIFNRLIPSHCDICYPNSSETHTSNYKTIWIRKLSNGSVIRGCGGCRGKSKYILEQSRDVLDRIQRVKSSDAMVNIRKYINKKNKLENKLSNSMTLENQPDIDWYGETGSEYCKQRLIQELETKRKLMNVLNIITTHSDKLRGIFDGSE